VSEHRSTSEIAAKLHEIYFTRLYGAIRVHGRERGFQPERDSFEKFSDLHKEALIYAFEQLLEKGLIEIPDDERYYAAKGESGWVLRDRAREHHGGNDDAMHNREAEPGTPEYDWMHRYDSPDNQRDTMG
jgi:hypothetical protein